MSTWLVSESELTPDQVRAVRLDPGEHRVIFGAPGSGKTLVLLHRAKYLSRSHHVPPGRFHIFVFTKVLKAYIRSALGLLDIPEACVSNFDSWCRTFYRQNISRYGPRGSEGEVPDFAGVRRSVLAWLQRHPIGKPYDFVLVDEGQDLDRETFEILTHVSQHVTACMDPKQQIFEGGASEADVLKALGLRKRNMSLLEAYRCTPYIVQVASRFVENEEDRLAYLRQVRVEQVERETPLLCLTESWEAQLRRLADLVRMRQAKGERVGILLTHRDQVRHLAAALAAIGLEVEVPAQREQPTRGPTLDFRSDLPKMMPFPSAKGLTFDSVLMPEITDEAFEDYPEERIRRLLFVGATRATKWLYFGALRTDGLPLRPLFEALGREGHLTIQEEGTPAVPARSAPPSPGSGGGGISDWF